MTGGDGVKKKKNNKFEGLIFRYTFDNLKDFDEALRTPFQKKHSEEESEDIETIHAKIIRNLTQVTKEKVTELYSNLSQHENIFSQKKFKKELETLGQQIVDETVEMVRRNLEMKRQENWIFRPHQKKCIEGEKLESILKMTEVFTQSQVMIETPALQAKLQSHFHGSDYKSLALDKISLTISVLAFGIAVASFFR